MTELLLPLEPFDFHIELKKALAEKEKLWSWFSDDKAKKESFDKFKKSILKDSYRMDETSHPEIFSILKGIKEKINLPINITLYQEQMSYQNNIGIFFFADEAHIVLSGRVLKMLNKDELKAILAHELYHYFFFSIDDKSYEIADRIITSIANDQNSPDVYLESARLFKLYTELYCDRGAYLVMGDIDPVISSLVKLTTGVDKVNSKSYIAQANEILDDENKPTEETSHPEAFIRAKALDLWSKDKNVANQEIEKLIEPQIEFDKLNIFSQRKLKKLTSQLINLLLKPTWNKTDIIINLAKEYFPSINLNEEVESEKLFEELSKTGNSTKKYLGYVLLDFALVDTSQGNVPLGYAFEIAENAGMKEEFNLIVKKELKITVRKLKDLQKEASLSLNQVNESKEDSLYGE